MNLISTLFHGMNVAIINSVMLLLLAIAILVLSNTAFSFAKLLKNSPDRDNNFYLPDHDSDDHQDGHEYTQLTVCFFDSFSNKQNERDLLTQIVREHNLLGKKASKSEDSNDPQDELFKKVLKEYSNLGYCLVFLIPANLFWVFCALAFIFAGPKFLLVRWLLLAVFMLTSLVLNGMSLRISFKIKRFVNQQHEDDKDMPEEHVDPLEKLPHLKVRSATGGLVPVFEKRLDVLKAIYEANANTGGVAFTSPLQEKLDASWMMTNTEYFQAMTKLVAEVSQDGEAMNSLIEHHDPTIKQIKSWTKTYRKFLNDLIHDWIQLSLVNREKYIHELIQKGDTKNMDAETRAKYFASMGQTIDELANDEKASEVKKAAKMEDDPWEKALKDIPDDDVDDDSDWTDK